jgi:hypothetical protein
MTADAIINDSRRDGRKEWQYCKNELRRKMTTRMNGGGREDKYEWRQKNLPQGNKK